MSKTRIPHVLYLLRKRAARLIAVLGIRVTLSILLR
jgi:hypothetical protein